MHIFYSTFFDGKIFTLDETESRHLQKVLRLKPGDSASVIDGSGSLYNCRVLSIEKKTSTLEVLSVKEKYKARKFHLHIAIAPTKNIDRFEWFIEKSVEMGIDKITPIICERSERKVTKTLRSQKIIISAMKQALQAKQTIISEALPLTKILTDKQDAHGYIAHCNSGANPGRPVDLIKPENDVLILIGPEGDFSPGEVDLALENGFREISLGSSRLRTETAGLIACSVVNFINQ